MPLKASGTTDPEVVDRFEGGVGWIAHPDEMLERTSYALADDGDVWLVDPLDVSGVDELIAEFGEVTGVAVLLDRHRRDAAALARKHDVPVTIPSWMTGVASKLDAPVERADGVLGDTGYELFRVVDSLGWQEAGLYDGETLYVPEALGTADHFRAPEETVGVHPMLRLTPPDGLGEFEVERLLVGHGRGLDGDAGAAIADSLDGARRRAPGLYAKTLRRLLG